MQVAIHGGYISGEDRFLRSKNALSDNTRLGDKSLERACFSVSVERIARFSEEIILREGYSGEKGDRSAGLEDCVVAVSGEAMNLLEYPSIRPQIYSYTLKLQIKLMS